MGLAFVFRLEESSIASHLGERAVRGSADTESVAITEAGAESKSCVTRVQNPDPRPLKCRVQPLLSVLYQ